MAILRGRLRPEGALVEVTLGPSQLALDSGAAAPCEARVWALFDTGADITVVQPGLAEQIGVYPHDRVQVAGMHESTATCNVLDVDLAFEDGAIRFPNITVVEGRVVGGQQVQMLIGRSVLWKGVLVFDGREQTFSFEVPDP